jgi:hypothetical protein
VVDLSDPSRPVVVASFVPPPSPARQTAATAQGGRRDMPLVWGVTRWKDLVLASDMNSGLWVIRVTLDGDRSKPAPGPVPTLQTTPAKPAPPADPGGWATAQWVALACLALALVAAGALVRSVRRRRAP